MCGLDRGGRGWGGGREGCREPWQTRWRAQEGTMDGRCSDHFIKKECLKGFEGGTSA